MISFARNRTDDIEPHAVHLALFVDLILVLVVIFIAAAPLATVETAAGRPASTGNPQPQPDKPIFLTLKADLSLWIGDRMIDRQALASELHAASDGNKDTPIHLRADRKLSYADIFDVLNSLRAAGYLRVALVGAS